MKETGSAATVAGDPTADGATLRIQLTTGGDQCVAMPSSGWSAVGGLGFKYKDAGLANGPVKADCDDGNLCTSDECLGAVGLETCSWTPIPCNDGLECTVDSCSPDTGCEHRAENPTTYCDDGDACTADDYADYPASCDCVHSPICL